MSKSGEARRSQVVVCLLGSLTILALIGGVLIARRRALRQASTAFYTPLTGEADWHGGWELSEQGADPSQAGSTTGADRVMIPFTGTDFALRVRRGGYRAYFWISVDGESANRLPQQTRNSAPQEKQGTYLVLSSPDYNPQVITIPVATGLNDGPHVAEIVADRGWDQWPLVGWRVSRRPDTTAYRWALAGVTACLLGVVGWGIKGQGSRRAREQGSRGAEGITLLAIHHSPFAICHSLFAVPIAAGVFYFSPWLPLTLVGLITLAALVLLRLDLGLALVALSAPFYLHPRSLLGKSFSMAEVATLLCVASWSVRGVVQWARSGEHPASSILRPVSSVDVAALCFVLVAVVSTFFADYRHIALRELRVVIVEPALFYLMLRTTQLDKESVQRVVGAFVLGGVAVALIGLAQYALDINIITAEQGFRRLRSVYGSPNNAALYLGRVLPVLVAVALFERTRWRRVAYGLGAVVVALALLLSFSRGAILLGVPLSLLALGMLAGGRWRWAALGVIAMAAVRLIPLLRTPRFADMLDPHNGTLFFRLQLWRASWKMIRDHLWLGVGPDNFLYQYRGRYILPAAWQEPHLSHAHNVVLSYATRLGLLGLGVGVWLQAAFWRLALPLRRLDDPKLRALALGLMGSMVSFLTHGLVDASYFFPDLAYAFFLALGLVQCVERKT